MSSATTSLLWRYAGLFQDDIQDGRHTRTPSLKSTLQQHADFFQEDIINAMNCNKNVHQVFQDDMQDSDGGRFGERNLLQTHGVTNPGLGNSQWQRYRQPAGIYQMPSHSSSSPTHPPTHPPTHSHNNPPTHSHIHPIDRFHTDAPIQTYTHSPDRSHSHLPIHTQAQSPTNTHPSTHTERLTHTHSPTHSQHHSASAVEGDSLQHDQPHHYHHHHHHHHSQSLLATHTHPNLNTTTTTTTTTNNNDPPPQPHTTPTQTTTNTHTYPSTIPTPSPPTRTAITHVPSPTTTATHKLNTHAPSPTTLATTGPIDTHTHSPTTTTTILPHHTHTLSSTPGVSLHEQYRRHRDESLQRNQQRQQQAFRGKAVPGLSGDQVQSQDHVHHHLFDGVAGTSKVGLMNDNIKTKVLLTEDTIVSFDLQSPVHTREDIMALIHKLMPMRAAPISRYMDDLPDCIRRRVVSFQRLHERRKRLRQLLQSEAIPLAKEEGGGNPR